MARIAWSPDARLDLERVLRRIARDASARSAEKWAGKLQAAVSALEMLPESARQSKTSSSSGYANRSSGRSG